MKPKFKVSLQVSMLSIFLSLFIATMITIMLVISFRFYDSVLATSQQQLSQVTSTVSRQLENELNPSESVNLLSATLLTEKIVDPKNIDQVMTYTINVLRNIPQAEMAYWGDEQGNFIISRRQADKSIHSEVILRDGEKATSTNYVRNTEGDLIEKTTTSEVIYDPRVRPWYLTAKRLKSRTWSDAYVFFTGATKTMGITSAAPVYHKGELQGVFGIDVRLNELANFLAKLTIGKNGVAFIIDDDGTLIAHPAFLTTTLDGKKLLSIQELNKPWQAESFAQHQKTKQNKFRYKLNDISYLANYQEIPSFRRQNWSIAVIVPEDDFVGELKQATYLTLISTLLILFGGVFVIMVFSRQIVGSLHQLVHQTDKIKEFDLHESEPINSHIKEVTYLESGITSMRKGLRAFQKYVPEDLVRNLIKVGEGAKIGGHKQEITAFFSDIGNFTGISERLAAEEMMHHLCDYFDLISNVIKGRRGTIDKYIGDALMAFWGAPLEDEKHCLHACQAALTAAELLKKQNEKWEQQGKPALPTRFGIHSGDAIIGNLGSSQRLNYTAIGDTINVASRLEQINKVYNTEILVSDTAANIVSNDIFCRVIDLITVKGKTESTQIYQLLGEKTDQNADKMQKLCELSEKAFDAYQAQEWQVAQQYYQQILQEYPDDGPARVFIQRCEMLAAEPPGKGWDGVWRFTKKDA